jgi:hypothetical protein
MSRIITYINMSRMFRIITYINVTNVPHIYINMSRISRIITYINPLKLAYCLIFLKLGYSLAEQTAHFHDRETAAVYCKITKEI